MSHRAIAYSEAEKQAALDLYMEKGVCEAMRLTSIPKSTIVRWAKAAGLVSLSSWKTEAATAAAAAKAKRLRKRIQLRLLERADEMLTRMDTKMKVWVGNGATPIEVEIDKPPASVCKDFATTVGILIDKYRLETGEVTSREEHRHIEESEIDAEIRRLLGEMAPREEARPTEPVASSEVRLGPDSAGEAEDS